MATSSITTSVLVAVLAPLLLLLSSFHGVAGQFNAGNGTLLLNFTSSVLVSVSASTPYVNISGTVTALATNPSPLYAFVNVIVPGPVGPVVLYYNTFPVPVLAPGSSYSGVLLQLITPPYQNESATNNSFGGFVYISYGLVNSPRTVSGSSNFTQFGLTVLPSVAQYGNGTLLVNYTSPLTVSVSTTTPYVNFTATITAPSTNPYPLYAFLSFYSSGPVGPVVVRENIYTVPVLAPGTSWSGVLFQVVTPPVPGPELSDVYGGLFTVLYGLNASQRYGIVGGSGTAQFQLTVTASGVRGDPLFVGLRGQRYQVHGVDGAVYNLISDAMLLVNAGFSYLDEGDCLRDAITNAPLFTCWTHRGSYLSSLAVRTSGGGSVALHSGPARSGFDSVVVSVVGHDSRVLLIGETATVAALDGADTYNMTISFTTLRTVHIDHAGLYSLTVENSDHFLNIIQLSVNNMRRLQTEVQSHGLIGQTWNAHTKGEEVAAVAGVVDDYVESSGDLLGCAFVNNKFEC